MSHRSLHFSIVFAILVFPSIALGATCINISTVTQLQGIGGATEPLSGHYCLLNDIDAQQTASWNNGNGFLPIGNGSFPFSGLFDGQHHTIYNLTIKSPLGFVGIFGANVGIVQNLALANVIVIATGVGNSLNVGGLVGQNLSRGLIQGTSVSGAVVTTASNFLHVGGLSGENDGTITASYSMALVSAGPGFNNNGLYTFGGLVGTNFGSINQSSTSGAVFGDSGDGGSFAGKNNGTISSSFGTGSAHSGIGTNGGALTGGFVGWNQGGTISQSYALGSVNGGPKGSAGGLIELDDVGGRMSQTYSTVSVIGQQVGGLVDRIGFGGGSATASYWDTNTSGQTASAAGAPITDAALRGSLPNGFSSSVWGSGLNNPNINRGYPYLLWQTFAPFDQADATFSSHNGNYVFVPIGQLDPSQYSVSTLTQKFKSVSTNSWQALYLSLAGYRIGSSGSPYNDSNGAGVACLATTFTMIARAVGAQNFIFPAANATIDLFQDQLGNGIWPTGNSALSPALRRVTFTSQVGTSATPYLSSKFSSINPLISLPALLKSGPLIVWAVNDVANDPTGHYVLLTGTMTSNGRTYLIGNDPLLGLQVRFPYAQIGQNGPSSVQRGIVEAISDVYNPNSGQWAPFTYANRMLIEQISHIEPERFLTNFNELCGCVQNGSRPYIPTNYEKVTVN